VSLADLSRVAAARVGGKGSAYASIAALAVVVALALFWPYRAVPFQRADGVVVPVPPPDRVSHVADTWDYLQLGRQLERGQGFTTLFSYVPFLPASTTGPPFPLYWRQPGYPVLVAAAFAVAGGPHPNAFLVLQGLSVLLLGCAALALARAVVGPGWAWLAAFWTLSSVLVLGVREPLVTTALFGGVLAGLAAAVLRARRIPAVLGTGALLGAAYLLRQETGLLVPGLLVMRWMARSDASRGRRMGEMVLAGLVALVVIAPWLVRSWRLTGDPLFNAASLLFHDTASFPSWTASRTFAVLDQTSREFLAAHPGEVVHKAARNFLRFSRDACALAGFALVPAYGLGILRPGPRARPLAVGFVILAGTLILALCPMEYAPRFLGPLVPLACALAAAGFAFWARAAGPRVAAAVAGAATVVGAALFVAAVVERSPGEDGGLAAESFNRVARLPEGAHLLHDGVVLTDAPTLCSWIWDVPTVWAPVPGDLDRVRALVPVSGIVLTCAAGDNDGLDRGLFAAYARRGQPLDLGDGRGAAGARCPLAVPLPPPGRRP